MLIGQLTIELYIKLGPRVTSIIDIKIAIVEQRNIILKCYSRPLGA
jgi:hypothetical protein